MSVEGETLPHQVAEAIGSVRPFGVDDCSRVRDGDGLERRTLDAFITAVRRTRGGAEAVPVHG